MTTLSEAQSKDLLRPFGVPFLPEVLVGGAAEVPAALESLGVATGPVAAKLCGETIAHKSERGLVRLGVSGAGDVARVVDELLSLARPEDEVTGVLLAPMVGGLREFLVGTATDPSFGPTVVVGVGGVLAEAFADISVRLVPIDRFDAHDMLDTLATRSLLGPFRGEPAVDRGAMVELLLAMSRAAVEIDDVVSIDLNPVRIVDGRPVALDALVEVIG